MSKPPRTCSQCGKPLSDSSPGGRCPSCLLALADEAGDRPEECASRIPCTDPLPRRFGDYDLLRELGRGGMGVVYLAQQRPLNRTVAVKMILGGALAGADAIARFQREAEAAAKLRHPGIITVHDFGEIEGHYYLAMEYVEGRRLSEAAGFGAVPFRDAARWIRELAEIVDYAHQHGVLHRDLKPSNILVDESGRLRITDFGLARRITAADRDGFGAKAEDAELTLTGQALGSPSYMPPEQIEGDRHAVGPGSDVYSLGAILYHLLAGRPPFVAESIGATLRAVQETDPPSLRQFNASIPRDLETLCVRCLDKNPSRRFARAQDLADELGRFLADQPIHTRPAGAMEVAWRWCRRNPRLAVTGAIALAGLLVITVGSPIALHRINTARREAVSRAEAENLERARAESILRKMELREAEEKLANDDAGRGLAILASILRREPAHRAVAERVVNELTLRNWPVLSLPPNELTDAVKWVQPSPDGQRFLAVDRSHRVVILSTANGAPVGRTIEHLASAIPVDRFHDSESALRAIFSPDGRCIGTASYDGTARIWSVETGEPVTPPMSHPRPVAGGSFSPDGRLIATACADGVARIWNAATGQPWPVDNPRIFRHGKAIIFAVFSPDGTRLLTGSADYSAQVWELATGDPIGQRLRHDRELRCGAFSPDGRRVVTGEQTGVVRVWDASSGQSVGADRIHERIVNTAVFSPDGRRILSTSHDQTARLWETDSGRPVGQPLRHRGVVRSALFSRDGTRIVTASEDGTARVWDAETGQPLGEPMPHGGPVWWAEFLPDGARVATASSDRMARIWEIRNGSAFTPTFMTGANVDQCHWSPDQQSLLVVAFEVRWINWSLPIPREIARVHGPGNVISGRFRPDGAVVFVGTQDRGFKLVETVTRKSPASNLDPSARVAGGVFSFDNRWLATLSSSNLVRLWESQNGQVVGEPLVHSAPVGALVFTTDGRLLTGTADGSVCAWEVPSGRLAWTQVGHREAITTLQRDSQGHKALSASRDGSVAIWHLADPGSPRIRLHHQGAIASAAFSTDGKRVVTASADGTARLWHAESGAPIGEPLRHQTRVEYVEFNPDGRRIATASADWTARVWDAATGLPLTTAMTHRGIVHHATFSPDGRWLATSSSDGTARIWPIAALPEGQSIPPWLPELAEAVAGVGWDGAGWTRNTSKDAFQHAEAAIAAGRTHGPLATWAAWWTADRWTRPLAPDLRGSIGSALDAAFRPNDDSLSVLESVDRWHPGHDQVQAQLAIGNAAWKVTNSPALLARLDTLSAGAMALNPDSLLSRWARAAFLDRSARLSEAITAMAGARELASSNAYFWLAYGDQLTRAGRADESATAHDRAVEIVNARTDWGEEGRTQVRYRRALSRARNGEPAELHAMLKIPARDPACSAKLVNLDRFYTVPLHKDRPIPTPYAPTFASLATGPQRLAGIEFDVRGLIGIADAWAKPRFPEIPERIDGIAVHSRCRRLHFLHTAVRSAEIGTTVARYRIRMEDGTIAEFSVVYGKDFIHWTYPPPASRTSDIALPLAWREYLWEDTTSGTATFGHLYLGTWDNPRPEVGVVTVDFLRGSAPVMPFLIAMTAEP